MYKTINNTVIPEQHFKSLAEMHVKTQNVRALNIGGKCPELKEAMTIYNYYEQGDSDDVEGLFDELGYLTDIPERSTVFLLDPSIDMISDMDFVRKLDEMPIGCFLIVVLQDVNLPGKEIPYGDSTLAFQSRLRKRFILRDNLRLRYSRARYDEGINHAYHAYVLERADVDIQNNLKKNKFDHQGSWQLQESDGWMINNNEKLSMQKRYVRRKDKSGNVHNVARYDRAFKTTKSNPLYQHPVKSVRRFPGIYKPGTFNIPIKKKADDIIYGKIDAVKRLIDENTHETQVLVSIAPDTGKESNRR